MRQKESNVEELEKETNYFKNSRIVEAHFTTFDYNPYLHKKSLKSLCWQLSENLLT